MKKLTLLTLSLLTSAAYADVLVKMTYTKDGHEMSTEFVHIASENPMALFQFGESVGDQTIIDQTFKVVLKEENPNVELEIYSVTAEGESLVMQPVISNGGSITLGNGDEVVTVSVKPIE